MAWTGVGAWARSRALVLVLFLVCAGLASAAQAQPASAGNEPSWLDWHGPLECQNTREVERELTSLLGREPDLGSLPPTRVELAWGAERGWTLRIRVLLPAGERRREVDVHTCLDGFDVVALTLALILDPSLQAPEKDSTADSEATPPPAISEGVPSPNSLPDAALSEHAESSRSAPAPQSTPPSPARAEDVPDAPALTLLGNARADLGSLPASLYGGGIELSLSAWQWRLDAGAGVLARGAAGLPGALYPVSYANLFGVLRGCRQFRGERGGYFGGCAGAQLGSLAAKERGGERRQAYGLWAAADLGATLGIDLSPRWSAYSLLELGFPLIRHELVLAGGTTAYQLPAITVQLAFGAAFKLTDWAAP